MEYFVNFITACPRVQGCVGNGAVIRESGPCCSTVQFLKCLLINSQPWLDPSGRTGILTPCLGIALQKHHV
jgi:hypothetical protein